MELSKENQIADIKGLMSDLAQCIVDLNRSNSELLNLSNGNKVEASKLAHDNALRSTQAAIESKFREYGVIQQIEQDQQKIQELEKRVLRAENIFYQLIEEEGCYCSDFNNLLPPEDQDSKVVADAINFMNDHIVKFKDNKQ